MPEEPLSPMAVYSAKPTLRVNSQEDQRVSDLLAEMRMSEGEGGLAALELRFSNVASTSQGAELAFDADSVLRLGAPITVHAGDRTRPREIFQGVITALHAEFSDEGPPELVVLAEDRLQSARMARRTKVHDEVSLAGLARDLAGQLGLSPVVNGLDHNIGTQVQMNESDLAFLRRLLRRCDGDVWVVGRELHVTARSETQRGVIDLELYGQLRSAHVMADLADQVTEVTITGWDAAQGQRVTGRARGTHLGPGQGRKGAELLQEALAERSHHIGHLAVTTQAEAQAVADAAFDERARRLVIVEATAEGNPSIRVGTHVRLSGLGRRFNNTYYVTRAVHRFDAKVGYETDFEAECAFLGAN
jgi:phage protein D